MSRRRPEFQTLDLASWPTIAWTELDATAGSRVQRHIDAIERYAKNEPVGSIEAATGVNRRQLYRLLDRALSLHADGRLYGFRALVAHARVTEYTRMLPVTLRGERGGAVGALSLLFERYPRLAAWLVLQIRQRRVTVKQIPSDDGIRIRLHGLRALHDRFLQECRQLGLTAADYPFNTAGRAIRSLSSRVKAELLRGFGTVAAAAGASHLKGLPRSDDVPAPAATRPYQVVEFDGHRLDVRLKVVVRDPLGFEHEFEIERVWLLAIIDVCTRVVLGYHLALTREYSRYDVIKTIENALEPRPVRAFTIPGLACQMQEGFASQRMPELAYVTWECIRLDNAKANLAGETLSALCEFVGCIVSAGPKHSPDERPYIERFFGTIASRLSSRLPGYTGSHPRDLRRALADPEGNLRLYVSIDELDELITYSIANYHGTPHGGLNGATPLEAMEFFVRGRGQLLTWLPEVRRRTLCLMQSARHCRVRGYLALGVRPHINLFGVRYTNMVLASSAQLIGQSLRIYINADDLRCVRAFLADGRELGVLDAQGAWRVMPHNLTLRREILKARSSGSSGHMSVENPIDAYVQTKVAAAGRSRRAASDAARTLRLLANAPTARTPTGPLAPDAFPETPPAEAAEGTVVVADTAPVEPVRPRTLGIGTGQVF
ncbi:integrase (plasmid) [Paraburkholderia sp. FT54]|uniref:integrase n=1 Tax=Paraburkholderia sp. FT54 TaxID=3074437 RepID=UPI002877D90A|nr:integrase [Paraburkholderia sp. FT54]WNC95293.1 integrase [Paraburkholderia sp. FT54]